MYIKKRWLLLFLAILILVSSVYLYTHFFQSNDADSVCCVKHKITYPPILTITESTPISISNLDSSKAIQSITYNILNQIEEGLMRLGPNDIPVPGLAESYQVSPDNRTYTFTIRKNATWSDGKPVTAKDFVYAWKRTLSPENQYVNADLFFPIRNAESFSNGKAGADKLGVSAPDAQHLVVELDKPNPNFLSLVTLMPFLPERQDIVEKFGDEYASTPEKMSFTGPFQLKTVTPKEAVLVKNNLYWDKANVRLQEVSINVEVDPAKQVDLFKSELTGMVKLDSRYAKPFQSDGNLKTISKAVTDFLQMNEHTKLLQNVHIRRAIQLALNREDMVTALQDGSTTANEIVPPVLRLSNGKIFRAEVTLPYQQEEAKEELAKGLQELNMNQTSMLTLITYNDQRSIILADQVRKQLHGIGLDIIVKKFDIAQKSKMDLNGDYDLTISEWSAKYHDPTNILLLWKSSVPLNISRFKDSKYDSLLEQASMEANPVKRAQLFKQTEKYLLQDQAVVMPLVYVNDFRLQKSYVKNIHYHPFGAEYSLKWATYQPGK